MCGIVGLVSFASRIEGLAGTLEQMTLSLRHRGPDNQSQWQNANQNVGLGHARLAIQDLSESGQQPMVSNCGRWVIVFNGEIYNHNTIREELAFAQWRGRSDTETLLQAIAEWGISRTLDRLTGMFAFAAWDQLESTLWLARDRFGEKPLYYGHIGNQIVFASELKAIKQVPGFAASLSQEAIQTLLQYNYIPEPYCIYEGISKLLPGSVARIDRDGIRTQRYWSPVSAAASVSRVSDISIEEASKAVHNKLKSVVKGQLIADVPVGCLLSGGVDSSLIASLLAEQSSKPINTYTIGFESALFDESVAAENFAASIGAKHTSLTVTSDDTLALVDELPSIYDEPFADSSQIPTALLSRLVSQHVTVALSGDGGDEVFGGYNRYTEVPRLQRYLGPIPHSALPILSSLLSLFPFDLAEQLQLSPRFRQVKNKADKTLRRLSHGQSAASFYIALVNEWQEQLPLIDTSPMPSRHWLAETEQWPDTTNIVDWMMLMDASSYLPGDILTKVDRASMASSLELRSPFLDHELYELVSTLPSDIKIPNGNRKALLKQILTLYSPNFEVARAKTGFSIPLSDWLKGPLRGWATGLLFDRGLSETLGLNDQLIENTWQKHLAGQEDNGYRLWSVLMLKQWLRAQN